jgi:ABC-2 type transport system ATP-binding protein
MNKEIVLSVRDLRKVYPGSVPFVAVEGISFDLKKGEILGLLGPNGAGKTTTIQMLLSTLKPTSGSIVYFGKNFFKHRSEILKSVVFASTYISLPWMLTVRQNLEIFARLYGLPAKEIPFAIDKFLIRFGILDKKNSFVSQLSAGQITRLMLVKAFMVRPKVVLLDEPTASLDPDIAKDVCAFVVEQRDLYGTSILFTSHNMSEVGEVCDRVLFLEQGKVIADDIPYNLVKGVFSCRIKLLVSDGLKRTISIAERFKLSHKIEHRHIELQLDEVQIAAFLTELAHAGVVYTNIAIVQPTLEDYFLKMVKRPSEKSKDE